VNSAGTTTELGRGGLLAWAAANDATVRLLYRKPDATAPEVRTVTPTTVSEDRHGRLYVIADDHDRHAPRTFLLSRLEGVLL